MKSNLDKSEVLRLSPRIIKLLVKTIKYSKGGLDKRERAELGEDLLMLAYDVLGEVIDDV